MWDPHATIDSPLAKSGRRNDRNVSFSIDNPGDSIAATIATDLPTYSHHVVRYPTYGIVRGLLRLDGPDMAASGQPTVPVESRRSVKAKRRSRA
jgi:hypothetical protein